MEAKDLVLYQCGLDGIVTTYGVRSDDPNLIQVTDVLYLLRLNDSGHHELYATELDARLAIRRDLRRFSNLLSKLARQNGEAIDRLTDPK